MIKTKIDSTKTINLKRAGGLAILVKEQFNFKQLSSSKYNTFEHLDIKYVTSKLKLVVVYRPPSSSLHQFIAEITSYFSDLTLSADNLLITGDFNLHLEVPHTPGVSDFKRALSEHNLVQHVKQATHKAGHLLDLVITRDDNNSIKDFDVYNSCISHHHSVVFTIHTRKLKAADTKHQVQDFRRLNHDRLKADFKTHLAEVHFAEGTDTLAVGYIKAVTSVIKQHAPVKPSLVRRNRPRELWYSDDIHHARELRRLNEKRWRRSGLEIHRQIFVEHEQM